MFERLWQRAIKDRQRLNKRRWFRDYEIFTPELPGGSIRRCSVAIWLGYRYKCSVSERLCRTLQVVMCLLGVFGQNPRPRASGSSLRACFTSSSPMHRRILPIRSPLRASNPITPDSISSIAAAPNANALGTFLPWFQPFGP